MIPRHITPAILFIALLCSGSCKKSDKTSPSACLLLTEELAGLDYYSGIWTYSYDASGFPNTIRSNRGDLVIVSADALKGTLRAGVVKNFAFSGALTAGKPDNATLSKSGATTLYRFHYDAQQRLISRASSSDSLTLEYDANGNLLRDNYYAYNISRTVPFSYDVYSGYDSKNTPYAARPYYKFMFHVSDGFYPPYLMMALLTSKHNPGRMEYYVTDGPQFKLTNVYTATYDYNDHGMPSKMTSYNETSGKTLLEVDQFTYSCK